MNIKYLFTDRFVIVAALARILLITSFITRICLTIKAAANIDFSIVNIAGIFFIGFFFDLVNLSYYIIPLVIYLWFVPSGIYSKKWQLNFLRGFLFLLVFIILFNAISEWFFWDEFTSRYNFIAVDYLIYTTEVIGNIRQSYPIEVILIIFLSITALIIYRLRDRITASAQNNARFRKRTVQALIFLALPVISFFTVKNTYREFSRNTIVNELAGNGIYELFAAYINNELDYHRFYATIDDKEAFSNVQELLKTSEAEYKHKAAFSVERTITNPAAEKKLNVILISVESLSAEYLGIFGNKENITPFLDSLSEFSLNFTRLYATGTRTVRGLEALALCVPPTPGQSIVRRPSNENLFSLGKIFNQKGYISNYFYGGYGYFDNMNYFFENNNYRVIDRSFLKDDEIDYENVWGVADENLFSLALREVSKLHVQGKPFFAQVMTTSNHRPFTYPEGRIDIPSHTNRQGAVKYTDYSIGKFISEAKLQPWFSNTVFIIVADHCASSAGKTELPVNKYHIPMLIYSPQHVMPAKINRLMSQIDIGPTLLGLLNFSYDSKFYGYDIFKLEEGRERVFISTYQNLGYITGNKMLILGPNKRADTFSVDFRDGNLIKIADDEKIRKEAISWYQAASYSFKHGLMK